MLLVKDVDDDELEVELLVDVLLDDEVDDEEVVEEAVDDVVVSDVVVEVGRPSIALIWSEMSAPSAQSLSLSG